MKKRLLSAAAALLCLSAAVPVTAFADEPEFSEKDITAYVYLMENQKTLASRFYSDLPEVPYVRLNDFYNLLLGKELSARADGSTFTLTNPLGQTAVVDTDLNTLKSDDFAEFSNTTMFRQDGINNTYFDGIPFVRVRDTEYDKEAKPTEIDFSGYGIDLRADGDELWVPFHTAIDFFRSVSMLGAAYNGSEYYFTDDVSDFDSNSVYGSDEFLNHAVSAFFKDGKRSAETAKFNYAELCFFIDFYYGFPGRAFINDMLEESGSLDAAITAIDEKSDGEYKIKDLLLSEDKTDYYAGLFMLDTMFFDGGHMTFASALNELGKVYGLNFDMAKEIQAAANSEVNAAMQMKRDRKAVTESIKEARNKVFGNEKYHKQGSTVVYSFDTFIMDFSGWKRYYKGEGERPVDEFSQLLDAMKKADEDPDVKNFVIDVSCNGGGSADIAVTIMRLIGVESALYFCNTVSDQFVKTTYDIDANFDGVFDEKDNGKQYGLNFAVLASEYSFSSGNVFPALCKDNGIPLFGGRTGGGACSVYEATTVEGLGYRISSNYRLTNAWGENVDGGVYPDYPMLKEPVDGVIDYTDLYDLEYIDAKMNEIFPEETESTPEESETPDSTAEESKAPESTPDESKGGKSDDSSPATGAACTGGILAVIILAGAVSAKKHRK